jgi:hypothetical protein
VSLSCAIEAQASPSPGFPDETSRRSKVSNTSPTAFAARYSLGDELADRLAGIDAVTSAAIEK